MNPNIGIGRPLFLHAKENVEMTTVVIAEKHSVANAIAHALGQVVEQDGWLDAQGGQVIVTWAQGHLIDLAMPEDYTDHSWAKWTMSDLPIDPTGHWLWRVGSTRGTGARYRTISMLLRRNDVDLLVNACDPDREGEAIWRRIIAHTGVRKPARRLWVASLETDAIRQAWESMRPASDYDTLAWAAEIRAKADWLIGINASRAYALLYGGRFGVGRVQTPTLALIVDRDRQIETHHPIPFWTVTTDMGGWHLTSRRFDTETEANTICAKTQTGIFHITSVTRTTMHDRPPRLYDLTSLQRDMSTMHAMTAARTLAALQHLYELGLASYPRTDSQYITHDDLPTLRALLTPQLADGFIRHNALPVNPRPEITVNDIHVAGHTAILPTGNTHASVLANLTEDERLVLTRIVRRMWEAVAADRIHLVTEVKATLDNTEEFTSRCDETTNAGWTMIEPDRKPNPDDKQDDTTHMPRNVIPINLTNGVHARPVGQTTVSRGETRPPKPFTDATLLTAMEHASRYVQDKTLKAALDDDTSHSGGIGTPATRADIIERLTSSRLVERTGRQLHATQAGITLINVVDHQLTDVALTARMEQALTDVEHGQRDPGEVMELFRQQARRIPTDAQANRHDVTMQPEQPQYGSCPRCGQPVRKTGRMWQCSTNKAEQHTDGSWHTIAGCGWKLYPTICGKTITDTNARRLLAGQTVTMKLTSRAGKPFTARLVIDQDKGVTFTTNR